jgi:voltage-gated sodium channel
MAIVVVILVSAVVVGLETSAALRQRTGGLFGVLEVTIQTIFVVEIVIRLTAFWPAVPRFFRDGWNTFDFVIVALSLLPAAGAWATVGRLARLMRASRLLSQVPELRLIIGTTLRSMRSMTNVLLLLGLLLYIYAVLGYHLFASVDVERWRTLPRAILTLTGVLTLEGWVDVQAGVIGARPLAWLYFLSFILLAVFVGLNLFIAIVINNLEATKEVILAEERRLARESGEGLPDAALIEEIRERLLVLEARLR